jgi:hypothetical protein
MIASFDRQCCSDLMIVDGWLAVGVVVVGGLDVGTVAQVGSEQ